MRMKMVCDDRTLRDVANEFLALKKAKKVYERNKISLSHSSIVAF